MTEFIKQYGAVYVTAFLCIMEILEKGMLGHTYKRLIRAASDMGRSEHRLMKTLRMKFDTCYQLKIGVTDVEVFVEKYLQHYRVLGMRLRTWETVGNLLMLLSILTGLGGAVAAMALGLDRNLVFVSLFTGIFGNGLILVFDCIYEIPDKRNILRIDILDFLENVYKPRLENETFHAQMVEEYQKEYFKDDPERTDKVVNLPARDPLKQKEPKMEFTEEEEEVILDVIKEYMG